MHEKQLPESHIWFSAVQKKRCCVAWERQMIQQKSVCWCHAAAFVNLTWRRWEQGSRACVLPVKKRCVGSNGRCDRRELRVAGATERPILSVHQLLLTQSKCLWALHLPSLSHRHERTLSPNCYRWLWNVNFISLCSVQVETIGQQSDDHLSLTQFLGLKSSHPILK